MVFKRSEYGREYKKSHLVKNIPAYYDHLEYRTHRRELEHSHTPLSWDFEDSSDSKTSSEEDVGLQFNKLKIDEEIKEDEEEEKVVSDDLIQQAKDKLQKYDSKDNQNNKQDEKKEVCKVTDDLQSKGDKKQKSLAKTYVCEKGDLKLNLKEGKDKKTKTLKSKSPERPRSSPAYRPPFMAYGCGDRELVTGVKRSFNVRASNDVYPAAMKALIDLHDKQKKREKARQCLSARERKRKALVLEKASKEVAGWQSEYRRMFAKYNNDEYARSASRIQDRPKCFSPYKF